MDLTLTEEQQQIRDAARSFLRAEHTPSQALDDDPRGYSPALWREMAELGWFALGLPEAHGGFGTLVELCLVVEEQGRVVLPSPFISTVVLAADAIARFGTEEQQATVLPEIVAGERVVAVARTGPRASWNPGDVGVVASADRDGTVLNGVATLVPYAGAADTLLVVAERPGGLGTWLVPADTEGLDAEPLHTVGHDHRYRVVFRGVRVPEHAALAGDGAEIATRLLHRGAVARCAELVGIGQEILDRTVAYARERVAFGKPIGAFQAVQHHCADMAVDVLTSRTVTWEAAWRAAAGEQADPAVSIAKAWVGDAIARVAASGHQVHGAIGFTAEHDLHLYTRRVRADALDFGDAAWHRGRVADALGL